MKNKLRKIVVADREYFYRIREDWVAAAEGRESYWHTRVVVFLRDRKQTPFELVLWGKDEYATGNALTWGWSPPGEDRGKVVNIHRPFVVRRVIEEALAMGWTGEMQAMRMEPGMPGYEALVGRVGVEDVVQVG